MAVTEVYPGALRVDCEREPVASRSPGDEHVDPGIGAPPAGSLVIITASGRIASTGASAIRRALPAASGDTVPSDVQVAP